MTVSSSQHIIDSRNTRQCSLIIYTVWYHFFVLLVHFFVYALAYYIIYRIPFVILSSSSLFAFIPRFLSGSYQSVVAWEPFPFFYITFILRDVTCDSWKISNQLILSSDSFIPWLLLSLFGWLLMMMLLLLSLFFAAPISHYILFSSVISWVEHLFLFAILSICHGLAACFTHASVILAAFYVYSTINVY